MAVSHQGEKSNMARAPQQRAPQASGEDDFYDDETLYDEGADGQDDVGGERDEDRGEADRTPEHAREGNAELEEEGELDDFEEPPQPRRGEGRVQRLVNERNEYRRRYEELETQTRQPPQQPQGPRPETDQEFNARISLLSPEERMEARHQRWTEQQTSQNQRTQLDNALQRDRDTFRSLARSDKRVNRLADQVEREFEKRFRAGQLVPRLDILKWIVGNQWLDGDQQGTTRAREAARRRVDRQTVRPASGGSDVRPSRREKTDERTARARRLEGQQI